MPRSPSIARRFHREDGREVLALQPFDEDVKGVARLFTAGGAGGAGHAVHEDAPRADLRRLLEEQAVRLLQLLPEYLARREDDFEFVLRARAQGDPIRARRVAHESVGRDFEQDDDAGLAELLAPR